MRQSSTTTTRSYRIYLRDAEQVMAVGHDVDFASDQEAREHAARMLNKAAHPCVEVWDRTRLVCSLRKEGISLPPASQDGVSQPTDRPSLLNGLPPNPR
jgi:hypothetical protein